MEEASARGRGLVLRSLAWRGLTIHDQTTASLRGCWIRFVLGRRSGTEEGKLLGGLGAEASVLCTTVTIRAVGSKIRRLKIILSWQELDRRGSRDLPTSL